MDKNVQVKFNEKDSKLILLLCCYYQYFHSQISYFLSGQKVSKTPDEFRLASRLFKQSCWFVRSSNKFIEKELFCAIGSFGELAKAPFINERILMQQTARSIRLDFLLLFGQAKSRILFVLYLSRLSRYINNCLLIINNLVVKNQNSNYPFYVLFPRRAGFAT